jgi:hypothetical protein
MLILFDGKGQLGTVLEKHINEIDREVHIHHKWNFLDKSEEKQRQIYKTFEKYVDAHRNDEVYFISTAINNQSSYLEYKRKAESYLLKNCVNGHVIRLPNMLGRGICNDFREDRKKPFGDIELITIQDATSAILKIICSGVPEEINTVEGEKISASMVYDLIRFGRNGLI